ncbi:MAG: hypothetical protein A2W19_12620 [Spirochaetes bacterium RBG_16_49_21]|nr:MAG: hypothetical protein A2W19_12620 [Spirochaetes bacterium RBG_16_49_21]
MISRLRVFQTGAITAVLIFWGSPAAYSAGHDFINEAKLVYRLVACGGDDLPSGFETAAVNNHCREISRDFEKYRIAFINKAGPFFAGIVPAGLPRAIVVPFGGGDLLPALIVYPNAAEYTTISLEGAGDLRRILKADKALLVQALKIYRSSVGFMLLSNDNSNRSVRAMEQGLIPNQLAFALTALAVRGYEPVSLKYITIGQDGSIHYLSKEEIDSLENVRGRRLKQSWVDSDFSVAFRSMELAFRKKGAGTFAPVTIHRHIAFNLDNRHFAGSELLRHLEGKGRVAVMVKGASYLLWMDNFKAIRDYLLRDGVYIVSDSTGILPRHAFRAGFEQITYGRFSGAFLDEGGGADAVSLRNLWQTQPYRALEFRFGYSDIHGANHLLITRPRKGADFHH